MKFSSGSTILLIITLRLRKKSKYISARVVNSLLPEICPSIFFINMRSPISLHRNCQTILADVSINVLTIQIQTVHMV